MEDEEEQAVPDADEVFEEEVEEEEISAPASTGRSPWLTAALVGVLALALGLFLGYVGRGEFGPEARAAKGTASAVAVLEQTQAAGNQELLKYLSEQTRHFKGDANAPVTIIEFSDFQ